MQQKHNLSHDETTKVMEYEGVEAMVLGRYIDDLNGNTELAGVSLSQQYLLHKALAKYGDKGKKAAEEELRQLHGRKCFVPVRVSEMTSTERKKAMQSLMYVTEKRDGRMKGRMVYDGSKTRSWIDADDAASPTVSQESIFLTATIDAYEDRDIMTADVPNAFIQAEMPLVEDGEERVMMKITGGLWTS